MIFLYQERDSEAIMMNIFEEKNELHNIIKQLRKRDGYTQKYVADYLDVDVTTYSRYESAQRTPDARKLKKLAELYKMRDELLGSTLPMETRVMYSKKELDDFQKVIEDCNPSIANGYFELKQMYDTLRAAFEPIQRRQMEALEFPNKKTKKLLIHVASLNDKTVQRVYLDPRAEYLTAIYLKRQGEIIDKMMGK